MDIEIRNFTRSKINNNFFKEIITKVLTGEKKDIEISVVLAGSVRMRKLNGKYRGKNRTTDVLSFGEGLNEIVICLEEVGKNARQRHLNFKDELARVLIHGVLHLLGYDHEKTIGEAKRMRKKEKKYNSWNL